LVFTMNARSGEGGRAIDIVDILEVDDDGKIASLHAYWDPAAMRPL
jgi:ketosteroid isomerase-like protein